MFPVSTTHTITGAIIGVGSIRRLSAVRWGVAGRIVWAWILTIPASALIAALTYWIRRRWSRPDRWGQRYADISDVHGAVTKN